MSTRRSTTKRSSNRCSGGEQLNMHRIHCSSYSRALRRDSIHCSASASESINNSSSDAELQLPRRGTCTASRRCMHPSALASRSAPTARCRIALNCDRVCPVAIGRAIDRSIDRGRLGSERKSTQPTLQRRSSHHPPPPSHPSPHIAPLARHDDTTQHTTKQRVND
jgi:hypothetical protein